MPTPPHLFGQHSGLGHCGCYSLNYYWCLFTGPLALNLCPVVLCRAVRIIYFVTQIWSCTHKLKAFRAGYSPFSSLSLSFFVPGIRGLLYPNGFLWLSVFYWGSANEGSSRGLESKRWGHLKYVSPLECCCPLWLSTSSCVVTLLHGSASHDFPPPTSSDLGVIMASPCCFVWVPQHPSLVPLTPPTLIKVVLR